MSYIFYDCTNFNQSINFDTSSVTNMASMFDGCSDFNQSLSFDTSSVTNMSYMFSGCINFNQASIANFNYSIVTDMSNFGLNWDLDTANYNALLIQIEATNQNNNYTLTASSTATGAGLTARTALINDHSVTVVDNTP